MKQMYFNECPDCGASLDPGEKCDCKRNGAALPQEQPQRMKYENPSHFITSTLSSSSGDVKKNFSCSGTGEVDMREFEQANGITPNQIIKQMHELGYMGYDRYLHSKVKNNSRYGVRLVQRAENAILGNCPSQPITAPYRDYHRLKHKVSCRVPKELLELLQQALRRKGFDTMQAGLTHIINRYLEETRQ